MEPLIGNLLFEYWRNRLISVPVANIERLLARICSPGRSVLNRQIRNALEFPSYCPQFFVELFSVNNDIELEKLKAVSHLFREECREVLRRSAFLQVFFETKNGLVPPLGGVPTTGAQSVVRDF